MYLINICYFLTRSVLLPEPLGSASISWYKLTVIANKFIIRFASFVPSTSTKVALSRTGDAVKTKNRIRLKFHLNDVGESALDGEMQGSLAVKVPEVNRGLGEVHEHLGPIV